MSLPAVAELLRALGAVCDAEGWRWYVFGAQAVLAYGVPRLTADVDVTIDPRGAAPLDVIGKLARAAVEPRAKGFEAMLAHARLLPLVHSPSGTPIDMVLAAAGIEDDFFDRVSRVDLGGVAVPVLSIEDLIATKVVAGRRKDLDDVRGILRQSSDRIDEARLLAVLADFDAALEEPRAQTTFARVARVSRQKKKPRAGT